MLLVKGLAGVLFLAASNPKLLGLGEEDNCGVLVGGVTELLAGKTTD